LFGLAVTLNIHSLPVIKKDDSRRIVDLVLVFQLFFLPQDKRDTSNVIGSSYYKKDDFNDMIYSISGSNPDPIDEAQIKTIKDEIVRLEEERKITHKRLKFAKTHPGISEVVNKSSDRESLQAKHSVLVSITTSISEIRKDRIREINRKVKLEQLISELRSLNRDLSTGKVICADCGSSRVVFKNNDYSFDVSNQSVRNKILESISEQIKMKDENIEELTRSLNYEQDQLKKELESTPKSIQTILLHSEEILSNDEIDIKLTEINNRVDELKQELAMARKFQLDTKTTNKSIISDILTAMNSIYKEMDSTGGLIFEELFTTRNETYSGSEEQEFYFAKLIALSETLNLDYPIIIDSFRDGELSSGKEIFMIKKYLSLGKQVILSSTLKQEEYTSRRYSEFVGVNAIDYSTNKSSHILNKGNVPQFMDILKGFKIEID
ncbi:MAG TPA: hypothetical protein DDW65_10735, partial [Firmicutes bacterium]|nr:hypothetical protein [Bacillota bacterium]